MLQTIFIILVSCFISSVTFFLFSKYEYNKYIKKLAEQYSLDEINSKIKEFEDYINNTENINSEELELTLDNIDLHEQIKSYKKEHNLN